MKISYAPYYTMPPCLSDYRPDGDMDMPPPGTGTEATQAPTQLVPISPTTQPPALTLESTEYLNGFLRTQIGKKVRVEFLIGTGTLVDKFGTLIGVGANYIMIQQAETDDVIVCDFYTIKFVTFYF